MMRGALLIGVNRTGSLPPLDDAARGVRRMADWASQQHILTATLTDEDEEVTAHAVKRAVQGLLAKNLDQLLIYFAGHGVNIRNQEYWLLSGAPTDTNEAVNVEGSVSLARQSIVPHVVVISDCCRTAAEGLRAQYVTGSEIFPNDGPDDLEKPVDLFFACKLGRPAHEVRDPRTTAQEYRVLYTAALVRGLNGEEPTLLEPDNTGGPDVRVVRPRPLKTYLQGSLQDQLRDLQLETKITQVPDARITSDPTAWVALFETPPPAGRRTRGAPRQGMVEPLEAASSELLDRALVGSSPIPTDSRRQRGQQELVRGVQSVITPFGPDHFETHCGFKSRGRRLDLAMSVDVRLEILSDGVVRAFGQGPGGSVSRPGLSALLIFEGGYGALLPIIPDFIGALTWEEGELVDVAYEPSTNSYRWASYQSQADRIRSLRAIAAASTRDGVFRLQGQKALEVAREMQYAKTVDPSLAVYAAYAYRDMMESDRIREMDRYMYSDLGGSMFDVALLARRLKSVTKPDERLLGPMPLLAQGWALLSAQSVSLAPTLEAARRSLVPSLWTVFDREGTEQIRNALHNGEFR